MLLCKTNNGDYTVYMDITELPTLSYKVSIGRARAQLPCRLVRSLFQITRLTVETVFTVQFIHEVLSNATYELTGRPSITQFTATGLTHSSFPRHFFARH